MVGYYKQNNRLEFFVLRINTRPGRGGGGAVGGKNELLQKVFSIIPFRFHLLRYSRMVGGDPQP